MCRQLPIVDAEYFWVQMSLNPFERYQWTISDSTVHTKSLLRINQLDWYTRYEYKKEDKKIWVKLQRMYLRKKFHKQRQRVKDQLED